MKRYFTSEAVSVGHPDRMCDIVVDALTAAIVKEDPHARVALEALTKTGMIIVAGELTTSAVVPFEAIIRQKIREIGYTSSEMGFDADTCAVQLAIGQQSPEIAQGVDRGSALTQGAGDQGIMFGYATDEYDPTFTGFMPLSHKLADALLQRLREIRLAYNGKPIWPDAKSQVTIAYNEKGEPAHVDTVLISTQHHPDWQWNELFDFLKAEVVDQVIPPKLVGEDMKIYVNPTGRFVIGGPCGDAGVVGRKLAYNNYGGAARIGGGNFHGKDMSKVDRSAAYMCRYVAKNIVAAELASRCEIQVSYAIGKAEPLSIFIETFGTENIPLETIYAVVDKFFDFRPGMIINDLDLLNYDVSELWGGCHFGAWYSYQSADELPPWERLNRVTPIRNYVASLPKRERTLKPASV